MSKEEVKQGKNTESVIRKADEILKNPKKLKELYIGKKMSLQSISELLGVKAHIVHKQLKKYGIKLRSPKEAYQEIAALYKHPKYKEYFVTPGKLQKMYVEQHKSINEIAKEIGCDPKTVLRHLRRYKIKTRTVVETKKTKMRKGRENVNWEILDNAEKLKELYITRKIDIKEIGRLVGVHSTTVSRYMKEHGIETRKQMQRVRIQMTKDGKHEKWEILDDKEALEALYVEQKLSTVEIGKRLGIESSTISKYLRKYGIPTRTIEEGLSLKKSKLNEKASTHKTNPPSGVSKELLAVVTKKLDTSKKPQKPNYIYKKSDRDTIFRDYDKLYDLYVNQQLSTNKIADIIGCNYGIVYKALTSHGIEIRSRAESAQKRECNDIPLTGELIEFLEGSLLGDGYLNPRTHQSFYELGTIHSEYAEFVSNLFREYNYQAKIYRNDRMNEEKRNPRFQLRSNSSLQLEYLRKRWYQNNKKIIPKDVVLTQKTCLYWYLEDGTLNMNYKRKRFKGTRLNTQGFTVEENERLVNQLKSLLQLEKGVSVGTNRGYPVINIAKYASIVFLRYIGNYFPVKCFDYKFKHNFDQ